MSGGADHPVMQLDAIDREAQHWVTRFAGGDAVAEELATFRLWAARDPAHAQAFARACRLWEAVGPAAKMFADADTRAAFVAAVPGGFRGHRRDRNWRGRALHRRRAGGVGGCRWLWLRFGHRWDCGRRWWNSPRTIARRWASSASSRSPAGRRSISTPAPASRCARWPMVPEEYRTDRRRGGGHGARRAAPCRGDRDRWPRQLRRMPASISAATGRWCKPPASPARSRLPIAHNRSGSVWGSR